MSAAFSKTTLRSITRSWGRFLALAIIVALGTGFYAGLRMTAPDMKIAANDYFDGTGLYDIRMISTLGFGEGQINEIKAVEGVAAVMPAYETDAMAIVGKEQYAVRIHSLDVGAAQRSDTAKGVHAASDEAAYLNRPVLVSGSWPVQEGECVLDADVVTGTPIAIGDTVELTEGTRALDEVLPRRTYTVTGFVRSPLYASATLGSTSLGSGIIQQVMYVSQADFMFKGAPYTDAFIAVAGAEDDFFGDRSYQDRVDGVTRRLEAQVSGIAQSRLDEVRAKAQAELDGNRAEYDRQAGDAQEKLDEGKAALDSTAQTLADTEQTLADTGRSLEGAAAQITSSEGELAAGQRDLDAGTAGLADQKAAAEKEFARARELIAQKEEGLAAGEQQLTDLKAQLAAVQEVLSHLLPDDPDYPKVKEQEQKLSAAIAALAPEVEKGRLALEEAKAALAREEEQAGAAFAEAQAKLDAAASRLGEGREALAQAQRQYASGMEQYRAGSEQYSEGLARYEEGLAAYEQEKADAEAELAQARDKLDTAQREIDAIAPPDVYVMDRTKNIGVESFRSDTERIDQIAQVFPAIFFLVAALVALTTMTRMVDEERVLIGTFKALGYSRARITSKYLFYAFVASGTGSLIGIAGSSQLLPALIFNAYGIMYSVPKGPTPLDPAIALISAGLGIGITLFATWLASASTLRERPAALMLPRAPKAGKRILLERVGFVWKRLSFSWKVTFRNLFRYKRRFVMTLIGIAGCTALLLTGLGLSNAINDIITKQFGQIYHYNMVIGTADEVSDADRAAIAALIDDKSLVSAYAPLDSLAMEAQRPGYAGQGVSVVLPQHPEGFGEFVTMRTRTGNEELSLSGDAVVVSEKVASQMGLRVGDTFDLAETDLAGNATSKRYGFTLTGIMENYIDQYVFMTPEHYSRITGKTPVFSTVYAIAAQDGGQRDELSRRLLEIGSVKTVSYNDEVISSYKKMLSSVNSVVWVLVIAAAALAFVVLYNLTNINIAERQREIATLKVLGFTPREVDSYIFREILLLTFIGCLIGLVFGVFMENYVVVTAEVDRVMFGREIHVLSFVLAGALTMAFAGIVALFMRIKLRGIDMVESLKSNE